MAELNHQVPKHQSGTGNQSSEEPTLSAGGEVPHVRFTAGTESSAERVTVGGQMAASAPMIDTSGPSPKEGVPAALPDLHHFKPPPTSRKRNRGHSLRRQLFFRNAHHQTDKHAGGACSSANDPGIELMSTLDPSGSKGMSTKFLYQRETDPGKAAMKGGLPSAASSLPHYAVWAKKQSYTLRGRIISYCKNAKKFLLRIDGTPPDRWGRKISVDMTRKIRLIDQRTGKEYTSNSIRSSRYTMWSFFPKQLLAQFSKLANFYFLCVSILQMIPTLSTTGTYTTIVPLLFFITLSMAKEGYDDYRRYKLDKVENNRHAQVLHAYKSPKEQPGASVFYHWVTTKWRNIYVGDIVKLERDDWVPADLLILHSDGQRGVAYVETMALDGEMNLKSKQTLQMISEQCDTVERLGDFKAQISVEHPNMDLYNFEGNITVGDEKKPLTNNQVVYRGSILRNTPSIWGLVIFSGEENKIRMNANKNPRTKAPSLQTLVNKIVIIIVIFVISLSVFNTVAYRIWRTRTERRSWYLSDSSVAFFPIFASYIIMFNTLIPLSLYVSMEIIKLAQMFFLNDIDMYDEETDTPMEARTSTINEDCGQVSYIFSDKTGTLTDNVMQFRKLSVGGQAWLHDLDVKTENVYERTDIALKHRNRKGKGKGKELFGPPNGTHARPGQISSEAPEAHGKCHGGLKTGTKLSLDQSGSHTSSLRWRSSATSKRPQPQLSTVDLVYYLQYHPHTIFARKARLFLLSIALCHTCLPEAENEANITYQAASPDELALVKGAQELGYIMIDRLVNGISIKTFPNGPEGKPLIEEYEVLDVIEFSSKRKRMSIIIRMPSGKFCIFCKGADSSMIELLRLRDLAKQNVLDIERRANKRKSLEIQEVIRRNSMQRTSIGGRSSIGGRPSFGGPSRLRSIEDEFGEWIRDKEEIGVTLADDESASSRPSGQYTNRHSVEREMCNDIIDEGIDETKALERSLRHINIFASEGLRTLLYGHRFFDEQEYLGWKKIYAEASTSLVDRQLMIERAAEMIERDFELSGATAIEDKLQKGVPDAIDKLRRAGIKLWMLTGDKRETAINIGHSCRLIKDYSMVVILDKEDGYIEKKMAEAILDINAGGVAHSVVVIDGGTLAKIDEDATLKSLFFDIAIITDSVICCRASPSQKASLVKTIRTKVKSSVTLAIGDGANDISMIQEAHVGIGITGKEGLQAARVSDYSMAQFRFLVKFLLVHGRWNYVRICKYTVATFWKELLFYLTQALFQRSNGYTGTSFYEPWSLSMFNTLFTSLPVIILGIFEKDLCPATLLAVPELYQKGLLNKGFNFRIYLGWMFLASTQAVINYCIVFTLYAPCLTTDNGIYAMGAITYSAVITIVSSKLQLIEMHNKSIIAGASFVLSIGGWFLWNIILGETYSDNSIYNVKDGIIRRFGRDLTWWLVYIFSVLACLTLDLALITIRSIFWPTEVDIFQEIEKSGEIRQRMEEAAHGELRYGWDKNNKKSKSETELGIEVEDFLDRPRATEEEGRSAGFRNDRR